MQLTPEQFRLVKEAAAARGVSMAEILRKLVDEHLEAGAGADRRQRAIRVIGRHRSGHRNVSREHDRDLADAFAR